MLHLIDAQHGDGEPYVQPVTLRREEPCGAHSPREADLCRPNRALHWQFHLYQLLGECDGRGAELDLLAFRQRVCERLCGVRSKYLGGDLRARRDLGLFRLERVEDVEE